VLVGATCCVWIGFGGYLVVRWEGGSTRAGREGGEDEMGGDVDMGLGMLCTVQYSKVKYDIQTAGTCVCVCVCIPISPSEAGRDMQE
jgi:hypothetical protein